MFNCIFVRGFPASNPIKLVLQPCVSSHHFSRRFFSTQDGSDSGSDSDDSIDWAAPSDDSDSDSDSDSDIDTTLKGRARWLKTATVVKEKVVKDKEGRAEKRKAEKEARMAEEAKSSKSKFLVEQEAMTVALVEKKLNEIVSSRGKRGVHPKELLRQLEALCKMSIQFGPRTEIPVLMHLINAQFDLQRNIDDYMSTEMWRSCAASIRRIATFLKKEPRFRIKLLTSDDLLDMKEQQKKDATSKLSSEVLIHPETGEVETAPQRAERLRKERDEKLSEEEKFTIKAAGSMTAFMVRLEEEYTKSLQKTNSHSPEYVARLRDEGILLDILGLVSHYYEKLGFNEEVAELNLLRLEHSYYKHDNIATAVSKATLFAAEFGEPEQLHPASNSRNAARVGCPIDVEKVHPASACGRPAVDDSALKATEPFSTMIDKCSSFIYKHGKDRERVRAILCHITYHAIHDRFEEGRDLLLMSKLQDTISNSGDISNMILFNRMMVSLGLCAFRNGKILDSFNCLSDVASGRLRELLAQGVANTRYGANEKNLEQEKAEKRRQTPYHQQLNIELIEATHLIVAMLLEVPNIAKESAGGDKWRRPMSRHFRKQVENFKRQVFTGPPENTREHIMTATKALFDGDWKTCYDLIAHLDIWKLVPGAGSQSKIQAVLKENIKEQALRTFLFSFALNYDSISLDSLVEKFDLTRGQTHSIVSKLLVNRELMASWDGPTSTIIMHRVNTNKLQRLALQYSDKVSQLMDSNEKLLDSQTGVYGFSDRDFYQGSGSGGWHGNNKNNRGYNNSKYHTRGRRQFNSRNYGGKGRGGGGMNRRQSNWA